MPESTRNRGVLARPADELLVYEGNDAGDLLHRLAATDLRGWADGASRPCLFTDDRGRVVDLPLARFDGARWHLLPSPARRDALADWIERFIILEDMRRAEPEQPECFECFDFAREPARWLRFDAPADLEPIDAAGIARAFIAAGVWRPDAPESLRPHPLEVGMRGAISFDKGCYVGQEVVARMDSYDKVRRRLAWVDLAAAAGSALRHDDREVGFVLSGDGDAPSLAALLAELDEGSDVRAGNDAAGPLRWVPAA